MKQKFIGALTMALLGISSDLTISGVNGIAIKNQAKSTVESKSKSTALSEANILEAAE